jgi:Berberine and berberine like
VQGINDTVIKAMPGVDFGAYPGYVEYVITRLINNIRFWILISSKYLTNGQHEYWGSNYPKLQQIKAKLDPQDVFWNPQSVRLPGQEKSTDAINKQEPSGLVRFFGNIALIFKRHGWIDRPLNNFPRIIDGQEM